MFRRLAAPMVRRPTSSVEMEAPTQRKRVVSDGAMAAKDGERRGQVIGSG